LIINFKRKTKEKNKKRRQYRVAFNYDDEKRCVCERKMSTTDVIELYELAVPPSNKDVSARGLSFNQDSQYILYLYIHTINIKNS